MVASPAELISLAPPAAASRTDASDLAPIEPPRVLLVAEGCYPMGWGGVSTWCDALIRRLPEVPFHVLAIVAQPGLTEVFDRLPNRMSLTTVPLWNVHQVSEAWPDATMRSLQEARHRTTDSAVREKFVPPLSRFVRALLEPEADLDQFAADIHALHQFLLARDLATAMRHPAVWDLLVEQGRRPMDDDGDPRSDLRLWELTTAFQWITRWLFPVARPFPEVDVVHLAMAGVCSMAGVAASLEHGAGLLLTEHGVYLRERYLAEAERRDSHFLKTLALGFALRMTQVTYRLAQQISPCCDYNQRWELSAGADPAVLETIYYGLDIAEYRPEPRPPSDRPTIVWVGRINPLKDVETLLRAAAVVARQRPDVLFRLYGGAQTEDADYHARCLKLHADLELDHNVEWAGYTDEPTVAYREADCVVLSSVSEGFPYSILEAMFCGRPVVASAVGGIPEQIRDTGMTVEPRNPEALGAAILDMIADPERLKALGEAARMRATTEFGLTRFTGVHRASYLSLSPRHPLWKRSAIVRQVPSAVIEPAGKAVDLAAANQRLVEEVRDRLLRPVDALEVAAMIESTGVTDTRARKEFGANDTFALAEAVFTTLRAKPAAAGVLRSPGSLPKHSSEASSLDTAQRPALAVIPTFALLTAIWGISASGDWPASQVLALVTGITTGMVCTTGIALALVRRGSALVSLRKLHAVRRFMSWGTATAVGITAIVAFALAIPSWPGLQFISANTATFVGAALVLSVVWTLATFLSLLSASGWTGAALAGGVAAGAGFDRLLSAAELHLAISATAGLVIAVGLMVRGLQLGLRREIGPVPSTDRTLPHLGFLVLEGLPNGFYGTVAIALFFAIHLIGGLSLGYESAEFLTLEFGLFLALVPSLLVLGTAERLMRSFWVRTRSLQHTLTVAETSRFSSLAREILRENTRRFLLSLVTLSLLSVLIVGVLGRIDPFTDLVPLGDPRVVAILFLTSLVAYAVFSWAQFTANYCLAFQHWTGPVRAAGTGLIVTVIAGLLIVRTIGYPWLALALGLGSAVYGWGTRAAAGHVLAHSDHHYATTV